MGRGSVSCCHCRPHLRYHTTVSEKVHLCLDCVVLVKPQWFVVGGVEVQTQQVFLIDYRYATFITHTWLILAGIGVRRQLTHCKMSSMWLHLTTWLSLDSWSRVSVKWWHLEGCQVKTSESKLRAKWLPCSYPMFLSDGNELGENAISSSPPFRFRRSTCSLRSIWGVNEVSINN